MKTVKTSIPKLTITYDSNCPSPREDDNLGYFITIDRRYLSPDKNNNLIEIIKDTSRVAKNVTNHIELITESLENDGEKVILILPVTKYEHSGISYSLGNKSGFDYSNNGFYIVTKKTLDRVGYDNNIDELTSSIQGELKDYNKWLNNEIYYFELLDENGEFEDSCGGFYTIDSIKEFLPKEWEDENLEEYIK